MVSLQIIQQQKVQRIPTPQTLRQWHYTDTVAKDIVPVLPSRAVKPFLEAWTGSACYLVIKHGLCCNTLSLLLSEIIPRECRFTF